MCRGWMKANSGVVWLALMLAVAPWAQAQPNNASINATANVLRPVTVAAQNNLDFGNVFPGVNASVALTDATAGRWQVSGETSAEVTLGLTLPANLTSGANTLPISFGATDAGYNVANDASTASTFDPSAGATTNLSGDPTGQLWVWIAGTVSPTASQAAGSYTGTITLTVDYTGN